MSIPFIRAAQRNCGHCKQPGHNQFNCPIATQEAEQYCQYIRNLTQRDITMVEQSLKSYFNLLTVPKLKNIMRHITRKLTPLIEKMIERNKLTQEEASMRKKSNRIKVLLWYFWYSRPRYIEYRRFRLENPRDIHPERKLDILAKSFELETDLTSFDCPICTDCKPGKERTVTNCNHEVCKDCIDQYFDHQLATVNFPKPRCSLCRTEIKTITFANTDYIDEISNKYFNVHVLI
jgi:hypothetical protein